MSAEKAIRIDREVYEWLRSKAVPFETPNEVLRRIAGLDKIPCPVCGAPQAKSSIGSHKSRYHRKEPDANI